MKEYLWNEGYAASVWKKKKKKKFQTMFILEIFFSQDLFFLFIFFF